MTEVVIALDVGGTSIKHGAVIATHKVVGQPITMQLDTSADAETLLTAFTAVLASYEVRTVKGIGFGFPGPFEYDTSVSKIAGFGKYETLYGMNIREELQRRAFLPDVPMRFRNDAEAAIVGEGRYGAGAEYHRVIGVTLGSGCGSAFLVDGVPQLGGDGVPKNGWLYHEPWQDSIAEDEFSIKGIRSRLDALGYTQDDPKSAAHKAREGEPTLLAMFQRWGVDMGTFLRGYVTSFQADAVLVMGGLSGAYDLFGDHLAQTLPVSVHKGLRVEDAALLGAADLIWRGH